ncbi:MAG: S1 RNA-binding domain-containing protein, partial [Candidatus Brocadiales bacterium]
MPKIDLFRKFEINPEDISREVEDALGTRVPEEMEKLYTESIKSFEVGSILKGRVLAVTPTEVIVDGGYKSEGAVPSEEFEDLSEVRVGDEIEVLLEAVEADSGLIRLSKRKADRIRGWERIVTQYKEGDVVKGRVMRKIKGGLLVDLGIPVFLPASQIDVKLPGDIGE